MLFTVRNQSNQSRIKQLTDHFKSSLSHFILKCALLSDSGHDLDSLTVWSACSSLSLSLWNRQANIGSIKWLAMGQFSPNVHILKNIFVWSCLIIVLTISYNSFFFFACSFFTNSIMRLGVVLVRFVFFPRHLFSIWIFGCLHAPLKLFSNWGPKQKPCMLNNHDISKQNV